MNLNLALFRDLKYFYAEIFVVDSKDLVEIEKSLGDLQVFTSKLSDDESSIVVLGASEDSERIVKVLRGFGIHPSKYLPAPPKIPKSPIQKLILK